ncbi:MAG: hypothetical protein KDN20_23380 [Verrucomicrobiae bacterium]|nr:hypothetical protein [Verrucomicrobiae bacterium]
MKLLPHSVASFFAGMVCSALAALLMLVGCAVSPGSHTMNDAPLDEFQSALTKLGSGVPTAETEAERRGLEQWKALLGELTVENVKGKASQVYAEETFFNDTLKTLRSGDAIEAYLIETAEMLDSGSVEYLDTVRSSDGSYYVRWEMVYRGKKLAGGEPIRTIGISQLKFNEEGRVVLHQDFWDSTRGIFEQIPVLGSQIRFIKKRL